MERDSPNKRSSSPCKQRQVFHPSGDNCRHADAKSGSASIDCHQAPTAFYWCGDCGDDGEYCPLKTTDCHKLHQSSMSCCNNSSNVVGQIQAVHKCALDSSGSSQGSTTKHEENGAVSGYIRIDIFLLSFFF